MLKTLLGVLDSLHHECTKGSAKPFTNIGFEASS